MGTATQTLACTEESFLFVGDQFSWLSWITLVHEFTSPRTFIQSLFTKIFPVTQPTKLCPHKAGKNLCYTWTLTPTNKNDSPAYLQIYDTIDSAPLLIRCMSWWIFYTCHTAPDSCLPPSDGSVSAKQKQVRLKIQTFIHLEVEV